MGDEENHCPHEHQQKLKKRRLRGACDACRKRKIKCDSAVRSGSICSNCETSNIPCTHDAPRQLSKKDTREAYVQSLEGRLEKIERIFRALHPDKDIDTLLDLPLSENSESFSSVTDLFVSGASFNTLPELRYPAPHLSSDLISDLSNQSIKQEPEADPAEEKQDLAHVELAGRMKELSVEGNQFFGQASTYMFAHFTMHAKTEARHDSTTHSKMLRRSTYWDMRPWELSFARCQQNTFVYPEPDLLDSLVVLYFEKSNIFMPVLHKPIFLRSLTSGLHLRDSGFGMTVLLVCAIASRFTSDSRVILDDDISSLSSGWKYYSQVPNFRNCLFEGSTIYDIQCYVLSTVYLLGTSMIHVAWPMIGLGLRFAQEKGFHRRKGKQQHTAEDELEKRAFWCLIVIDRWMSAFVGRPCGMQDEEFDLEYLVECDDEYWETSDPEDAFKQPPGKPSTITYFNFAIKLVKVLGLAHRTLYATKKSKMLAGLTGSEWELQAVAELDSSMNKLNDSIPDFLRWNPENRNATFFWQSIALYTSFYHLQIQIHRPFLMKRSPTSLAICNNAASSSAYVLEAAMSRGAPLFPSVYMSAFTAALVLLITHWVYQQPDSASDPKGTMALVRKLLYTLKDGERKWHVAGRLCDLTQILGCLSDQRSNPELKRRREPDHVDPHTCQSQQNYDGSLWEQAGFSGETLQRQTAAEKLDPLASYGPTNALDINTFLPTQIGDTQPPHSQQPLMTSGADNNLSHPTVSFLAETNLQPSPSTQDAHLLDPLQAHSFAENPIGSMDDLFKMWANVPMNFSPNEWQDFLSEAM